MTPLARWVVAAIALAALIIGINALVKISGAPDAVAAYVRSRRVASIEAAISDDLETLARIKEETGRNACMFRPEAPPSAGERRGHGHPSGEWRGGESQAAGAPVEP